MDTPGNARATIDAWRQSRYTNNVGSRKSADWTILPLRAHVVSLPDGRRSLAVISHPRKPARLTGRLLAALAVSTLAGDPAKIGHPQVILYLGFVQAAVYDAVVGIDGRY